jgi:hypothetical protein
VITEPHREIWIGPGVDPSAFGYVLAALTPANAPKHGGHPERNACANHPTAGTIRRTVTTRKVTYECAECRTILDTTTVPIGNPSHQFIPAPQPIQQDAFKYESEPAPMPQDVASTTWSGDGTGAIDQSSKMRHSPPTLDDDPPDPWASYPLEPPTNTLGHDRWSA